MHLPRIWVMRDGIHHLYAHTLGAAGLAPKEAINVVVNPSHWIMDINVRVDAVAWDELQADLTWMVCRLVPPAGPIP